MSNCKECGSEVNWVKVARRWFCHNPDGSDHWDLCSKLKTERIKRTGEYIEIEEDKAYLTAFKKSGIHYMEQHANVARGKKFKKSRGCKQCVPPWEICPNGCPNSINI